MESDVIMPIYEVLKEIKSQNINWYIIKQKKPFFKDVIIVCFYVIMRDESRCMQRDFP